MKGRDELKALLEQAKKVKQASNKDDKSKNKTS